MAQPASPSPDRTRATGRTGIAANAALGTSDVPNAAFAPPAGRARAGWGDIDRRGTVRPALSAARRRGMLRGMASSVGTGIGRWLYPGGRPNRLARVNRLSVVQVAAGLLPERVVTLEVPGRASGRTVSFPLVAVEQDGATYLVAMLGRRTNWVRNVAANGGRAVRCGAAAAGRSAVELQEVDPADRAPILKRFLAVAPGARPHIPVDRHAPLAEFAGSRRSPGVPGSEESFTGLHPRAGMSR